jgi:hypothetical protein
MEASGGLGWGSARGGIAERDEGEVWEKDRGE